ncbi:MAG: hypothetical protein U0559_17580 [Anaerolineae bacterium]
MVAQPDRPAYSIETRQLTKVYRTAAGDFTALKGIDLQIGHGEFVAVLAPGAGKSTMINLIIGIDHHAARSSSMAPPSSTCTKINARRWRGLNLGVVFNSFNCCHR